MPHVYDLRRTKRHPTTFPSPWHQDGDEILLYFLESGDSCALSMGTYMGSCKSSIRAVTEQKTSLLIAPVAVGQAWIKKYTSWSTFVMESYQSRLEEMLEAIDA